MAIDQQVSPVKVHSSIYVKNHSTPEVGGGGADKIIRGQIVSLFFSPLKFYEPEFCRNQHLHGNPIKFNFWVEAQRLTHNGQMQALHWISPFQILYKTTYIERLKDHRLSLFCCWFAPRGRKFVPIGHPCGQG